MKVATCQERLNELFDSDPRSDTAIAKALGVSKQTVSMWRNGSRSPKKSALLKIAEIYNVSIEWLMGFDVERSGEMKIPSLFDDRQLFLKYMQAMPTEDYKAFIDILRRAEQKLKEQGEI